MKAQIPLLCDALTAYRHDIERAGDIVRFGSSDDTWIRTALHLEAARRRPAGRENGETVRSGRATRLRPQRILALAEQIETAGALRLSFCMLDSARRLWYPTTSSATGSALFQQARIARTLGEMDRALDLYMALRRFAQRHRKPDLTARALNGIGVINGMRGALDAAYRSFSQARRIAGASKETAANSWHGEMSVALARHDASRALIAGHRALQCAHLPGHAAAALLVNLAGIALQAQRSGAAISMLRDASRLTRHPRVRAHVFARMALAWAVRGDAARVQAWARRLTAVAPRVAVEADVLEARLDVARALLQLGQTARARRLTQTIRARADTSSLRLLVRRCDELISRTGFASSVVALTRPALRIVHLYEEA